MPDLETVARLDIRDALSDIERLASTLDEVERQRQLKIDTAATVREFQRVNREIGSLTGDRELDIKVNDDELLDAARLREDLGDPTEVRLDVVGEEQLEEAVRLRDLLDGLVASVEVDADLDDLQQAFELGERLNNLRAFIDVDTDGADELREVLDIGEQLERLVAVVQIEARDQELREAAELADSIEGVRRVSYEADTGELRDARQILDSFGNVDVTVDVETGEIVAADRLLDGLGEDQRALIRADADTNEARREIQELGETQSATVRVDADVSQAEQSIRDLEDDQVLTLDVDIDRNEIIRSLAALDLAGVGSQIGGSLTDGITSSISGFASRRGVFGLAGVGIGAALVAGTVDGIRQNESSILRQIEFGLSDSDLASTGKAGADAYVRGFGDSLSGNRRLASEIERAFSAVEFRDGQQFDALGDELDDLVAKAATLETVWGITFDEISGSTRRFVSTGLVDDLSDGLDLAAGAVQEFGDTGLEALEVVNEFAPVFDRFGISGESAVRSVASVFERGLLPNVDRFAEILEELNIQIQTGDAEEALDGLGLDIAELQQQLATGEGDRVLLAVIDALREIEDLGQRQLIAESVFKTPIESAGDLEGVLEELFLALDNSGSGLDEYAGKLDEATEAQEQFLTTIIGNEFREFNVGLGEVNRELGGLAGGFIEAREAFLDTFAGDVFLGVASLFGSGPNPIEEDRRRLEEATEAAQGFNNQLAESSSLEAFKGVGPAAELTAQNIGVVEENIEGLIVDVEILDERLEAAVQNLESLFNFGGNQALRETQELIDNIGQELAEIEGLSPDLVNPFGDIDITTQAGRELEEVFESYGNQISSLGEALSGGQITLGEFNSDVNELRASLIDNAEQLGLNRRQIESLVEEFAGGDLTFDIAVDIREGDVQALINRLSQISQEERIEIGIDVNNRDSVEVAALAISELQQIDKDLQINFDVNEDSIVSVRESIAQFTQLEASAQIGFNYNGDGELTALEAARAFQELRFFSSLGFDVDFSGKAEADEVLSGFESLQAFADLAFDVDLSEVERARIEAQTFELATYLANVGYSVDLSGLQSAINSGESYDVRDFIATAGHEFDDSDLLEAQKRSDAFENDPAIKILDADSRRFFEKVNGVRATSSALEQNPIELTIRARDQATAEIDRIARNRTSTITVVTRRTNSIIQADGGIIGSDGTEYMESGGVLNGIHKAQPGGVSSFFNGRHVITAENGGDELFLNQYSRPSRQIELIQSFAGGQLDQHLRRHYQGSSGGDDGMLRRIASSLERIEAQGPGDVPIQVVAPDNPILDPVLYAKELARQTRREARARALAGAGR